MKTQLVIKLTALTVAATGLAAQLYSPDAKASSCNGSYRFCTNQLTCTAGINPENYCNANKPAGCGSLINWQCLGLNVMACNTNTPYTLQCNYNQ